VYPIIKTKNGKELKVKILIDSGCTNTTIARKTVEKKEYLPNYSQNHLICITQMNQEMKKDNQGICTSGNQLKWTHQIT